jgi:uncharacterized membrane protein
MTQLVNKATDHQMMMAKAVNVLYLAGLILTGGLLNLAGLIIAYVQRGSAPAWLQTHFTYQIRTFWIGALYALIGIITAPILVGIFVLFMTLVWVAVRCVRSWQKIGLQQAIAQPRSWGF